jgi:hypothetical protein
MLLNCSKTSVNGITEKNVRFNRSLFSVLVCSVSEKGALVALRKNVGREKGDRIGRMFAYRAVVSFL